MARYLLAILAGRHQQLSDVIWRRFRRAQIACPVAAPLQADGDPAGYLPADVEVIPAALQVLVP